MGEKLYFTLRSRTKVLLPEICKKKLGTQKKPLVKFLVSLDKSKNFMIKRANA